MHVVTGSGIHPWLSHQQEKEKLVSGERNFRGHRNRKKLWIFFSGNRKVLHITGMTQTFAQRMAGPSFLFQLHTLLKPPKFSPAVHDLPKLTMPAWTTPPLHIPGCQPHC